MLQSLYAYLLSTYTTTTLITLIMPRSTSNKSPTPRTTKRTRDLAPAGEQMDFPIEARVQHEYPVPPSPEHGQVAQTIQGGALKSWTRRPGDPDATGNSERFLGAHGLVFCLQKKIHNHYRGLGVL